MEKRANASTKRGARNMSETENRYRRLFETAPDGILILDADTGRITDVNPSLTRILGYPRKEFIDKRLEELVPFKNALASIDGVKGLNDQESTRFEDLPLETRNGRRVSVEFIGNA